MDEITLTAPRGSECLSLGGTTYRIVNGRVTVPLEYAAGLYQHGFTAAPDPAKKSKT